MMCSPLMHNSKLTLFMTEGVTDVQMFPSLICLWHVKLEWEVPVSMPVSETQWIYKTHSPPFILRCWNNNVSRDPHIRAPSERICVLHLHDLPHFSIWDGRLHHLSSSKQLTGFITWLARRCCHGVQQWHEPATWNGIFSSDGMPELMISAPSGGWRESDSFTYPAHIFSSTVRGWTDNLWVSTQFLSPGGGRLSTATNCLFMVSHSSMRHQDSPSGDPF